MGFRRKAGPPKAQTGKAPKARFHPDVFLSVPDQFGSAELSPSGITLTAAADRYLVTWSRITEAGFSYTPTPTLAFASGPPTPAFAVLTFTTVDDLYHWVRYFRSQSVDVLGLTPVIGASPDTRVRFSLRIDPPGTPPNPFVREGPPSVSLIARIDPSTGEVESLTKIERSLGMPFCLVSTLDYLWLGCNDARQSPPDGFRSSLSRVDLASGCTEAPQELRGWLHDMAAADGNVWVAKGGVWSPDGLRNLSPPALIRVDASSGKVAATIEMSNPTRVAVADGVAVVTCQQPEETFRVDPVTNAVSPAESEGLPPSAVRSEISAWEIRRGKVVRVDPATGDTAVTAGPLPRALRVAETSGAVWALCIGAPDF